jgi:fluoride exporter
VTALLVVLGLALSGAAGSLARHEFLAWSSAPATIDRARAIAVVNLVGALLVALLAAAPLSAAWVTVLGVGFCGSLTTFSTWVLEAVLAREAGRDLRVIAAVDLVGQLAVGVGLVLLVLAVT